METTIKISVLERIGQSEVHYCERNNVFAEYEVKEECGKYTLVLYIHGYANSRIAQQWQNKLPEGYTINVTEREENNIFIYAITLEKK